MCLNKRWITNQYDGRRYFVNCGHCPACLQEKAVLRSNRIRYSFPSDGSELALFVTLTYKNSNIPYIRHSDLSTADHRPNYGFSDLPKSCLSYVEVPIYRDKDVRWNRYSGDYKTCRRSLVVDSPLAYVKIPSDLDISSFKYLKGQSSDRIGVIYYSDVQNFIKRLKINLQRKFHYESPLKFFSCAEYGPTTCRPHFHLLIFCPRSWYKNVSLAIAQTWSYDDYNRTRNNISIAKDAASYVSSYVNCGSSIPEVFKFTRSLSSRHSYSHGFGSALDAFNISKILSSIGRGDLTLTVQRLRKGTLVNDTILCPKYIIHRFFPKFKGFNRLTPFEIFDLVSGLRSISSFSRVLELDNDQVHKISTLLYNKRRYFKSLGISCVDYAFAYSRVWSIYASNLLRRFYESIVSPIQNFYAYDNVIQYFESDVGSLSLDQVLPSLGHDIIVDANYFPQNVLKHTNLSMAYNSYSKDRKVRNFIYSQSINV